VVADSTVLITLAGHAPSAELLQWRAEEAEICIAVDGGWLAHRHAGVEPDLILGDLDSCGDLQEIEKIFPRSVIERVSDQNLTDFEKALDWLENRGLPGQLVVLGGLGKRTDHCLSNLMITARVDPSVEIIFDDEHEWVRRITPACPLVLSGRADTPISLLPIGEVGEVNSSGLHWELSDADFSWDQLISQSNRCSKDEVKVSCQSGVLYAFVSKEA
jgi:thiamine pyrophosphokinase